MPPSQRRQVLIQVGIHRLSGGGQPLGCPLQVNRVPQNNGGGHQVEAAGPVSLLLEAPISNLAEAVKEHRPGQGVSGFTLVKSGMHTTAQLDAL